ncbi:MMPL family transporter [Candidatus Poriferisodalis sp.]|uniref:MMPL family transporter n=1 Tax=Candidatus Poriferisodalis sp. TaxID=3101277 RepID=UPI003B522039
MYAALGRWCFRNPWRVLAAWLGIAMAAGLIAGAVGASYGAALATPDSESDRAADVLETHFGSVGSNIGGTIVIKAASGVHDPAVRSAMSELLATVAAIDEVTVSSPYDRSGRQQIAQQGPNAGQIAFADIQMSRSFNVNNAGALGEQIIELIDESGLRDMPGVEVEMGGSWLAGQEPPETEAIGLAFAVFVLIAAVGSVVAMGVTVGTALIGVGIGALTITILSNVVTVPDIAPTLGVMIGLGVGIDYALIILNRFREWLHHGFEPLDAVGAALDSAGRSVVFAGATVVVSLLGLLLIGLPFVAGMGLSAAITVTIVMAGSMTLLPAMLGLFGERMATTKVRGIVAASLIALALLGFGLGIRPLLAAIPVAIAVAMLVAGAFGGTGNPLRRNLRRREPKALRDTAWYRLSRVVQGRPWLFALGGTAVLLLLAAPALGLRLGFSDEGNYPPETTTRKAYELVAEGFGPGANGPLFIVAEVSGPADLGALNGLSGALNQTDGITFASPALPSSDGGAALIRVQPSTGPQDVATETLVHTLRDSVIPASMDGTGVDALVGGAVAFRIDFSDYLAGRMLIFFAAVLGASFLLLMAVFRSVVVPLKAVIMNMLSIGASYGVLVAVFQWGWFGNVLGIEPAPIEPFIPMMLFAVLFGLSMDYEVFLLSRMKEEYERTGDPVNSVADGLAATARVITAAAAIMVVVFGSFVLEDERVVKLFGMGLATAIAIDATLVRMLIVPSTMELLGARNWWLPAWLDRIIPNLRIEGELPGVDRLEASEGAD